jgi:hypothetical protein
MHYRIIDCNNWVYLNLIHHLVVLHGHLLLRLMWNSLLWNVLLLLLLLLMLCKKWGLVPHLLLLDARWTRQNWGIKSLMMVLYLLLLLNKLLLSSWSDLRYHKWGNSFILHTNRLEFGLIWGYHYWILVHEMHWSRLLVHMNRSLLNLLLMRLLLELKIDLVIEVYNILVRRHYLSLGNLLHILHKLMLILLLLKVVINFRPLWDDRWILWIDG